MARLPPSPAGDRRHADEAPPGVSERSSSSLSKFAFVNDPLDNDNRLIAIITRWHITISVIVISGYIITVNAIWLQLNSTSLLVHSFISAIFAFHSRGRHLSFTKAHNSKEMEALADVLQPYKEVVGTVAAVVTIGQMFSGSFICYDIYKQRGTRGITIAPFLGGVVMSLLNLKYGYILRDPTMVQVNLAGLALNIVYTMIYFHYTAEKMQVWAKTGAAGALSAALLAYAQVEDPALVENRFGTIITAFMFYLIASPLFGLKTIIKNKSTEGLPFPIIFSGTIVTFAWLLYGIILRNKFLVLQNTVAVVLCSAQLSLFAIYPSRAQHKAQAQAKAKAKKAD